jgi:hypothetical protein
VELGDQVEARQRALAERAVADPPRHLTARLGPVPDAPDARRTWQHAAEAVEAYRDRTGVTGRDPLGPRPDGFAARAEYDRARQELALAERGLGRAGPARGR